MISTSRARREHGYEPLSLETDGYERSWHEGQRRSAGSDWRPAYKRPAKLSLGWREDAASPVSSVVSRKLSGVHISTAAALANDDRLLTRNDPPPTQKPG